MIDATKKTGLLAAAFLAAVLGGRAPSAGPREIASRASCRFLVPGSREILVGHVDCAGPVDRDAFSLVAERPCRVRFRLTPTLPGTDLDLCVQGRTQASETIAIAGERLDLEVRSAWGSSSYCLEIEAR